MIAKYKDEEVHAKCVDWSNNKDYDKTPEGLSLEFVSFGEFKYTFSDGIGELTECDVWTIDSYT